jgi:hypothetical protein
MCSGRGLLGALVCFATGVKVVMTRQYPLGIRQLRLVDQARTPGFLRLALFVSQMEHATAVTAKRVSASLDMWNEHINSVQCVREPPLSPWYHVGRGGVTGANVLLTRSTGRHYCALRRSTTPPGDMPQQS